MKVNMTSFLKMINRGVFLWLILLAGVRSVWAQGYPEEFVFPLGQEKIVLRYCPGDDTTGPFYIMETKLSFSAYDALQKTYTELPTWEFFDKNSAVKHTDRNDPLHGVIPYDYMKAGADPLMYVDAIRKRMSKGLRYRSLESEFQIPTAREWTLAQKNFKDASLKPLSELIIEEEKTKIWLPMKYEQYSEQWAGSKHDKWTELNQLNIYDIYNNPCCVRFVVRVRQTLPQDVEQLKKNYNSLLQQNKAFLAELEQLKTRIEALEKQSGTPPVQMTFEQQLVNAVQKGSGGAVLQMGKNTYRFIYIPPGAYRVGLDDDGWQVFARQLYGPTMSSIRGEYQVTLQRGFFIMDNEFSTHCTWQQAHAWATEMDKNLKEESIIPDTFAVRLPTEIEWECAARGANSSRIFPWEGTANVNMSEEKDVTPSGIRRLSSGMGEWCLESYQSRVFNVNAEKKVSYYPYDPGNNDPKIPCVKYTVNGVPKQQSYTTDTSGANSSNRVWRGASKVDIQKNLLYTRVISFRRSEFCDKDPGNISFRFVLIPNM